MKKLTTLITLVVLLFQVQAQLYTTYTVDANLPTKKTNFRTIQEAINFFAFEGLSGNVVLELASGVYTEPVVIEGIQSDLDYSLHITNTESGKVQFVNDGLSLYISNSSNVTISNIHFEAISTEISNMVILSNADNVLLESNDFIVSEINNLHKSVIAITNTSQNNIVRMNTLKGASGFEINRLSNNNTVASNDVSFANAGISVLSSLETKIECNLFKGILTDFKTGIVLDGFVGDITITSNAILSVNEGISQLITYRPSDQKVSGNIINNLIESKGNTITLNNNVRDLQIAFNTFTSKNSSVIYFSEEIKESVSKITLFANNLLNLSDAPIIYVENPYVIAKTDYNNIYNENGSFYTKIGNVESKNLSAWKLNMNAKNAVSVDPMFVSFGKESYQLAENSPCINAGPNAYDIGSLTIVEMEETNLAKNVQVGAGEYDKATFEKLMNEFQLAQKK